ncbi:MAG: hypothetical protein HY322_05105 [Betaproteobacteria bacterium]|nr:hypothetical protein [Betaproteobacteria bacterium]
MALQVSFLISVDSPTWITHPAGTQYRLGSITSKINNIGWAIVVVETGKGNVQAAIATERALHFFNPDIAIFVGCAGARKDCKIGDVIVASKIYDYESGAETAGGFKGNDQGVSIPAALLGRLKVLGREKQHWIKDAIKPDRIEKTVWAKMRRDANLIIRETASGEKTQKISDSPGLKKTAEAQRDAVALESEGHGFLKAIHSNNHQRAFVVRGISDYGPWEDTKHPKPPKDPTRDGIDQPASTALAAAFAFHYVSQQEPILRLYDSNTQGTAEIYQALSKTFSVPDAPRISHKLSNLELNFDPYTNAGFFAEAIAMRIAGRHPRGIDSHLLCEVVTLCQKAGHLDVAWRFLLDLLSNIQSDQLAIKAHLYLTAIKLLSQSEDLSTRKNLIKCAPAVINWLEITGDHKKIASVYSRAGVAHAALNDNLQSKQCFTLASEYATKKGNRHQEITVRILWAIASALRGVQFDGDPLQTVINAQVHYLDANNTTDPGLAQAYPMKSATQCLFSEAAILLHGRFPEKGRLRLAAAGILRRKGFSHPNAEGFAELLALIPEAQARNLVRFVMDPSSNLSVDPTLQPYLKKCMSLSDIFSFSTEHWKQLRQLLDEDHV